MKLRVPDDYDTLDGTTCFRLGTNTLRQSKLRQTSASRPRAKESGKEMDACMMIDASSSAAHHLPRFGRTDQYKLQ